MAILRLVRLKILAECCGQDLFARRHSEGYYSFDPDCKVYYSGGYYSFDPDCKVYYKKSGGTPPQNIKGEPSSGLLRHGRCYGVAQVTWSEVCAVSREESGCQPRSLWRGTLIGLRIHLRLGLAHYRSDRRRDDKLEGGYITEAQ